MDFFAKDGVIQGNSGARVEVVDVEDVVDGEAQVEDDGETHENKEGHEHAVVVDAYTVIYPRTVMIKPFDTSVACTTVS